MSFPYADKSDAIETTCSPLKWELGARKRPSWIFYKHLVSNELIWNIRWLPIVQIIQNWSEGCLVYIWLNLNCNFMLPLSSYCWVPFFNNMSHVAIIESYSPSKCTFYYYMRFFKMNKACLLLFFISLANFPSFNPLYINSMCCCCFFTFTILMMVKGTEESSCIHQLHYNQRHIHQIGTHYIHVVQLEQNLQHRNIIRISLACPF
jgi:hypothetical protein